MFVPFLLLDGTPVEIESNLVTALEVVPASLLPTGVPAGSYVTQVNAERTPVQGTMAATAAALTGAVATGTIWAIVKMSSGAILAQNAAAMSAGLVALNTGVGQCTVSINAPGLPVANAVRSVGAVDIGIVCASNGLTPTTIGVEGFDLAGAVSDVNFSVFISPAP